MLINKRFFIKNIIINNILTHTKEIHMNQFNFKKLFLKISIASILIHTIHPKTVPLSLVAIEETIKIKTQ